MKTLSETANAQNIKSMEQLSSYLSSYKVNFKSKNLIINNAKLEQLTNNAKEASQKVAVLTNSYCQALINREDTFKLLTTAANSVLKDLNSLDISKDKLNKIYRLVEKVSSFESIENKKLKLLLLEVEESGRYLKEIDNSEKKYTKITLAFALLIDLLESYSNIDETTIKIDSLKELHNKLITTNRILKEVRSQIINARKGLYNTIYKNNTGLVDVAHDTKVFMRKTYGNNSKEWEKVSSIEFKRIK